MLLLRYLFGLLHLMNSAKKKPWIQDRGMIPESQPCLRYRQANLIQCIFSCRTAFLRQKLTQAQFLQSLQDLLLFWPVVSPGLNLFTIFPAHEATAVPQAGDLIFLFPIFLWQLWNNYFHGSREFLLCIYTVFMFSSQGYMTYGRTRGLFYWLAPGVVMGLHSLYWCHILREVTHSPFFDRVLGTRLRWCHVSENTGIFLKAMTQSHGIDGWKGPLEIPSSASCSNWANTSPCFPTATVDNYFFALLVPCCLPVCYCFHIISHGPAGPLTETCGWVLKAGKRLEFQDPSHTSSQLGGEEGEWVERRGQGGIVVFRVHALVCLTMSNEMWLAVTYSEVWEVDNARLVLFYNIFSIYPMVNMFSKW